MRSSTASARAVLAAAPRAKSPAPRTGGRAGPSPRRPSRPAGRASPRSRGPSRRPSPSSRSRARPRDGRSSRRGVYCAAGELREAVHHLLHDVRAGLRRSRCTPRAPGRTRPGSARCRAGPAGRASARARGARGPASSSIMTRRSSSESASILPPRGRCGSRRRSAGTARALERGGVGDQRRSRAPPAPSCRGQHREAGLAAGHHVRVVAEDRQRVRGERARGDVHAEGRQLARDLVHVRDHQEQALRRGERRGQRPGLERAVDGAGRARPRTASRSRRGTAPQRFRLPSADHSSDQLAHGRGRRDRIDRDDLAQRGGRPRRRPRCRRR